MTEKRIHVASVVPPAVLAIALGFHPGHVLALVVGVLLPEVDTFDSRFHRSWVLHTFLAPAVAYNLVIQFGLDAMVPELRIAIHFVTVGMVFHFLFDFVYPKGMEHDGAEWPVRPTVFSEPWGLMWLGLSWFTQWFVYLSPYFLPWLIGQ